MTTKIARGLRCKHCKTNYDTIFISIHSFLNYFEVTNCSCLMCGYIDLDVEDKFYTLKDGKYLSEQFIPSATVKRERKRVKGISKTSYE